MIGPAFREWALKLDRRSHFDELPGWQQAEEVAKLKERLSRYGEDFEIRVSADLRHSAMCRGCKVFVCGARGDLTVIEQDMQAHACKEVPVDLLGVIAINLRLLDEEIRTAPVPFFTDEERGKLYRECQEDKP